MIIVGCVDRGFATKPAMAAEMIAQAMKAGVSAARVTGDEVDGGERHLSVEQERCQFGYLWVQVEIAPRQTAPAVGRCWYDATGAPANSPSTVDGPPQELFQAAKGFAGLYELKYAHGLPVARLGHAGDVPSRLAVGRGRPGTDRRACTTGLSR